MSEETERGWGGGRSLYNDVSPVSGGRGSLYSRVPCPDWSGMGGGGSLYGEVQWIMNNGHMGNPLNRMTDITEDTTFPQLRLQGCTLDPIRKRQYI